MSWDEFLWTDKNYQQRMVDVHYHNCESFSQLMENDLIMVINATANNPTNEYFIKLDEVSIQIHYCPFCGQNL